MKRQWLFVGGSLLLIFMIAGCGTTSSDTTTTTTVTTTTTTTTVTTTTTATTATTTSTTTTTIDPELYYPETEGLINHYNVAEWSSDDGLNVYVQTEEVSVRETVPGLTVEARKRLVANSDKGTRNDEYFNTTSAGVDNYLKVDTDYVQSLLLDFPLTTGKSWDRGIIDGDIPVLTSEVIGLETVQTPLATYEAMKILSYMVATFEDGGVHTYALNIYNWYAPNVGEIKALLESLIDGIASAVTTKEIYLTQP
jgi:hypothetical protein